MYGQHPHVRGSSLHLILPDLRWAWNSSSSNSFSIAFFESHFSPFVKEMPCSNWFCTCMNLGLCTFNKCIHAYSPISFLDILFTFSASSGSFFNAVCIVPHADCLSLAVRDSLKWLAASSASSLSSVTLSIFLWGSCFLIYPKQICSIYFFKCSFITLFPFAKDFFSEKFPFAKDFFSEPFPFAKDVFFEPFPFAKDFCFANSAFPFDKELLGFALALYLPFGKACAFAFAISKKWGPFDKENQKQNLSRNAKLYRQHVFSETTWKSYGWGLTKTWKHKQTHDMKWSNLMKSMN